MRLHGDGYPPGYDRRAGGNGERDTHSKTMTPSREASLQPTTQMKVGIRSVERRF
jgi:hypothetical protein